MGGETVGRTEGQCQKGKEEVLLLARGLVFYNVVFAKSVVLSTLLILSALWLIQGPRKVCGTAEQKQIMFQFFLDRKSVV